MLFSFVLLVLCSYLFSFSLCCFAPLLLLRLRWNRGQSHSNVERVTYCPTSYTTTSTAGSAITIIYVSTQMNRNESRSEKKTKKIAKKWTATEFTFLLRKSTDTSRSAPCLRARHRQQESLACLQQQQPAAGRAESGVRAASALKLHCRSARVRFACAAPLIIVHRL